jgi:hypothetical protein
MTEEFKPINLGGYEGDFKCPNCDSFIHIDQGNGEGVGSVFICPDFEGDYSGCGKEWQVFAKEVTDD